jgi:hypothetical protein
MRRRRRPVDACQAVTPYGQCDVFAANHVHAECPNCDAQREGLFCQAHTDALPATSCPHCENGHWHVLEVWPLASTGWG